MCETVNLPCAGHRWRLGHRSLTGRNFLSPNECNAFIYCAKTMDMNTLPTAHCIGKWLRSAVASLSFFSIFSYQMEKKGGEKKGKPASSVSTLCRCLTHKMNFLSVGLDSN